MTQYNYQTLRRLRRAHWRAALKGQGLTEAEILEALDAADGDKFASIRHATDAAANTNTTAKHFFDNDSGRTYQIQSVRVMPDATLTAHSSNYLTITVEKEDGAAGGKVTVATLAASISNWAVGVAVPLTNSSTPANLIVDDDAVLSYKIVKSGTGVACPACNVQARMRPYSD
jgi:hypothetical protein